MSLPLQNINTYTYSPGFQLGQYHNAVLCISGNVQSLYLDGNLIATKTGPTNVLANYSNINQILIGCAGDKSSGFSGYLDDFRMYNYTLNETQVSNLYTNRNIVAYYPFDNSLNGQTPNYVTLMYDANFVGNAATISTNNSIMGNGSLQLTNATTAGSVKSYVSSSSGFSTSATNGISISLWFKASGVSARRMRLFDLCKAFGAQGISVDISGTNGIVAGYSVLLVNAPTINAVSYPDSTSATIYFTPSTTSEITDYQYSFDNITYTSIGIPTNSFTINNLTGINTVYLVAVKYGTVSSPSTFSINPSYTSRATIGGIGSGKALMTPSYEYYVFTNTAATSTLTFANSTNIEYLLVAAGGNGGSSHGGGGGAGGVLSGTESIASSTAVTITVGKPAVVSFSTNPTNSGGDSIISFNSNIITAYGGAGGAAEAAASKTGGSGGGAGSYGYMTPSLGTSGQGYAGGTYTNGGGGGGGGGAGGAGGTGAYTVNVGGPGGVGGAGTSAYSDWIITISRYMNTVADISWSIYTISGDGYIASGGAGGACSNGSAYSNYTPRTIGGGGIGGTSGSSGLGINIKPPTIGIPNTGGGGGGFGGNYGASNAAKTRKEGGSGIAIIRIPLNQNILYLPSIYSSDSNFLLWLDATDSNNFTYSSSNVINGVKNLGYNTTTMTIGGNANNITYLSSNSFTNTPCIQLGSYTSSATYINTNITNINYQLELTFFYVLGYDTTFAESSNKYIQLYGPGGSISDYENVMYMSSKNSTTTIGIGAAEQGASNNGNASNMNTTQTSVPNTFHIVSFTTSRLGGGQRIGFDGNYSTNGTGFPGGGISNVNNIISSTIHFDTQQNVVYIKEALGFTSSFSFTQIQQMEGYLAWKWGLQTNLPNTHPYYASAPNQN